MYDPLVCYLVLWVGNDRGGSLYCSLCTLSSSPYVYIWEGYGCSPYVYITMYTAHMGWRLGVQRVVGFLHSGGLQSQCAPRYTT